MTTARRLAVEALTRIEDGGAYANLVLPSMLRASELSDADRRFATELVYGTTRMRRACDAVIDRFVTKEPDAVTRRVLRLGAYQLVFAGVPDHAAVSASVDLAPKATRSFVNAVLRRVARTPMVWPDESTRLSYPDWIIDVFEREVPDEAIEALEHMNTAPPVTRRDDGYVQDRASQMVVEAVAARPLERVLDVCAGPGGKSTGLAASGARVIGADVSVTRATLVARNAHQLGHNVPVLVADGRRPPFAHGSFDCVLVDAPCSGLGALRRRPDARWRITLDDVNDLVDLQREILGASAELVAPGGRLVYSVCTITAAESIDHRTPDGFEIDDSELPEPWQRFGSGHRLLPHVSDTDGMVVVRYRRVHG